MKGDACCPSEIHSCCLLKLKVFCLCRCCLCLRKQGLVKDSVVLKRLVRQVLPEDVLALSIKQSGIERRQGTLEEYDNEGDWLLQ